MKITGNVNGVRELSAGKVTAATICKKDIPMVVSTSKVLLCQGIFTKILLIAGDLQPQHVTHAHNRSTFLPGNTIVEQPTFFNIEDLMTVPVIMPTKDFHPSAPVVFYQGHSFQ